MGALGQSCVFLQALLRTAVWPNFCQAVLVPRASWETMGIPVWRGPTAGIIPSGKEKPGKQAQDLLQGCGSDASGEKNLPPLGKLFPPLPTAAEGSPSHSHWQSRAWLPFSPSGVSPNQCPQGHSGVISVAGKRHHFLCDTTFQVRPKLSVCASYQPQNMASQVSGREDWTHVG